MNGHMAPDRARRLGLGVRGPSESIGRVTEDYLESLRIVFGESPNLGSPFGPWKFSSTSFLGDIGRRRILRARRVRVRPVSVKGSRWKVLYGRNGL